MTSKNLFFKLQKEDLKRRIWTLALIIIVMFLILPIRCAMEADSYYNGVDIIKQLIEFMGPSNALLVALTIISAIVSGLSGFYYLQSRKKVDLYHSIPVKRETLFSTSFLNGILIYAVPYIINVLMCFVVLWLKHYMCSEILGAALMAFGIHMLFYCLIYTITIIAVMMTGNIVISFMGTMVFLFYGPMWVGLWKEYGSDFFKTYYSMRSNDEALMLSSPLLTFIGLINKYLEEGAYQSFVIISVIELLVFVGLAVFLYKKRPSEAAGKAMAFSISMPIIKFLLVIPIALGGGITLRNIVSGNYDGWFVFGIIFTLLIAYGFIQVIYHFDIRSAFMQIKHLFACIIITFLIACLFRFDVFRYDTYIPKMNEVKSMSVYIEGNDQQMKAYDPGRSQYGYTSNDQYQLQHMKMTDFNAAYSLAKVGIESRDIISSGRENYRYTIDGYYNYVVKYTLKSGRTVYRKYYIKKDMSTDLLEKIYNNEEYKKTHYSINEMPDEEIDEIIVDYVSDLLNYEQSGVNGNGNIYFSSKSNSKDIKQLMQIYREELNQLSFKEASESYPIAALDIIINGLNYSDYYIYPSFTKTLNFLKEHEFDISKTVDLNNITEITVMKNANKMYEMDASKASIVAEEQKNKSYHDKKDIEAIFPVLVTSNIYQNNSSISKFDSNIEVIISYKDIGERFSYYFIPGKIPDFVKKDLEITD